MFDQNKNVKSPIAGSDAGIMNRIAEAQDALWRRADALQDALWHRVDGLYDSVNKMTKDNEQRYGDLCNKFAACDTHISTVNKELADKLTVIDTGLAKKVDALEQRVVARIDKLEQFVDTHFGSIERQCYKVVDQVEIYSNQMIRLLEEIKEKIK